jgi:hypothetical protein
MQELTVTTISGRVFLKDMEFSLLLFVCRSRELLRLIHFTYGSSQCVCWRCHRGLFRTLGRIRWYQVGSWLIVSRCLRDALFSWAFSTLIASKKSTPLCVHSSQSFLIEILPNFMYSDFSLYVILKLFHYKQNNQFYPFLVNQFEYKFLCRVI